MLPAYILISSWAQSWVGRREGGEEGGQGRSLDQVMGVIVFILNLYLYPSLIQGHGSYCAPVRQLPEALKMLQSVLPSQRSLLLSSQRN